MADLIIGVQGSGKSYRAVNHIYDNREDYVSILTNINGLKFEGNIRQLNFSKYMDEVIRPIYFKFKENNNISDDEINSIYCSLTKTIQGKRLLIVDEAQNFFNKKDGAINWLVTYHRHLNIDLILVSQLVSGIHIDNRIFNNVYEALNPSKQFIPNKIRYNHYLGLPANASNYNKKDNIAIRDDVFSLYQSGGKVKKKNILIVPLLLLVFALSVVGYGFYHILGMFSPEEPISSVVSSNTESTIHTFERKEDLNTTIINYEKRRFTTCTKVYSVYPAFSCDFGVSWFPNIEDHELSMYIDLLDAKIVHETINSYYKKIYIVYNYDRLKLFYPIKEKDDAKKEFIPQI